MPLLNNLLYYTLTTDWEENEENTVHKIQIVVSTVVVLVVDLLLLSALVAFQAYAFANFRTLVAPLPTAVCNNSKHYYLDNVH